MQKVVRVLSLKEQTAAEMKRAKTGARVNDEKQVQTAVESGEQCPHSSRMT